MRAWSGELRRYLAGMLAVLVMTMTVLPHIPPGLLDAWGFGLVFVNSGSPGHPYLQGTVEGEGRKTWFLCLNQGASARSGYDYSKVNADVSYADGTMDQKRLFWAYIGAFGSADGDSSLNQWVGGCTKDQARQVAWKQSVPAWVESMANDGFMGLEQIPAGCMRPEDIFELVSRYNVPEKAMGLAKLCDAPGHISAERLYTMTGLDSWDTFRRYCTVTPYQVPAGFTLAYEMDDQGISFQLVDGSGIPTTGIDYKPMFRVSYDPSVFRVVSITGTIEYFQCKVSGSQQLARAKGHADFTNPEFYLTAGAGYQGGSISGGGNGDGITSGSEISVTVYEHKETFESNYQVELTKRDYETGQPLKDAVWQVLEAFPDQEQLTGHEENGSLREKNMREAPVTWDQWLVFETDMRTDEDGRIHHHDQRFYDYDHQYCDGHPEPEPPESDGGGEEDDEDEDDEYERLMEQWAEAVAECEELAAASKGTFHHWVVGGTSVPSEAEAFEGSGCRADRDMAYENFIHLRYSYTFREEDARDGYIIHGQNGHPDDVPVEIVTTAASEAGDEAVWTKCSNEDIVVSGYVRNLDMGSLNEDSEDDSEEPFEGDAGVDSNGDWAETVSLETAALYRAAGGSDGSLRISERSATASDAMLRIDLDIESEQKSFWEKGLDFLRTFFGLPKSGQLGQEWAVTLTADPPRTVATSSDAEEDEELQEEEWQEIELENDLDASQAGEERSETLSDIRSGQGLATPSSWKVESQSRTSTASDWRWAAGVPDAGAVTAAEPAAYSMTESVAYSMIESAMTESAAIESATTKSVTTEPAIMESAETESETSATTESAGTYTYQYQALSVFAMQENSFAMQRSGGGYVRIDAPVEDSQPTVEEGPHDATAHTWVVYDHRVPGQLHFNKRDMDLKHGEGNGYDSYGDTQGDTTLEGAIYGLFAADDIYGPDTQRGEDGSVLRGTGVIFDANDLVAVAVTDKNGDGSFMAVTERPHSIYNYKTGQIEYTGKAYPKNLYDMDGYRKTYEEEETGRIYRDFASENGDCWIGRPLILGSYYIRELSRSEGYELSVTGKDQPVTNAATVEAREQYGETEDAKSHPEGRVWISQKLQAAMTFPEQNAAYGNRENLLTVEVSSSGAVSGYDVVLDGLPAGADIYADDIKKTRTTVLVPSGGQWVDATEAPLYETAQERTLKRDQNGNYIPNPDAEQTLPIAYTGIAMPAKCLPEAGTLAAAEPDSYSSMYSDTEENFRYVKYELEQMLRSMGAETPKDAATGEYSRKGFPVFDEASEGRYGMPEVVLRINQVTTNQSLIEKIIDYYVSSRVFTYGSLQAISMEGQQAVVTLAVGLRPGYEALYETDDEGRIVAGYLLKVNEGTGRLVIRKYEPEQVVVEQMGNNGRCRIHLTPDYEIGEDGMPEDRMTYRDVFDQYLYYETGEILYDYCYEDGSGHEKLRRRVYQVQYEEQEVEEETFDTKKVAVVASREAVADPVGSTYVVYDGASGQYVLHVGAKAAELLGNQTCGFTVALENGSHTVTVQDLETIGDNNVWGYQAGDQIPVSEYLVRIHGAGAGVSAAASFDGDTSYIKNQHLIYNGNHDLCEDGNTSARPAAMEERAIRQQIKVTKRINTSSYINTNSYSEVHEDWFTKLFGGFFGSGNGDKAAEKVKNFRFKVYLRSNLARLYRDEAGNVVWQTRSGADMDAAQVLEQKQQYPELVPKLYTKVRHRTAPLYQDSRDGVIANDRLYSSQDGLILEKQNPGYTAVLETVERTVEDGASLRTVKGYNYDKFFDAVAVANHDKWDDAAPTYTSLRPLGNEKNRTEAAVENARYSDHVRQFAIDWYLDDEVKKLVRPVDGQTAEQEADGSGLAYSDALYDEALYQALRKAENYLKPFFDNDLDEIYAIGWDSASGGGSDQDRTTLSADTMYEGSGDGTDGYAFGVSGYLPYGTYVVAEQQPRYGELEDFVNRHYQIDRPREVEVPSVYEDYVGSQASPERFHGYYQYQAADTPAELERKYKIRFLEEGVKMEKGVDVILSRNASGDFEVYKYGLEVERVRNGVPEPAGEGDYYALTQSEYRPYKNYYNEQDDRSQGLVDYYLSEALGGAGENGAVYRYSSVSEHRSRADGVAYPGGAASADNVPGTVYRDKVITMHGVQTAFDGKYASMLVPWSVTASDNPEAEKEDSVNAPSGESRYRGFAYAKLCDRLFTAKLRLEKLDSETHENLLHDSAVFAVYAAKRDDGKNGEGRVLFYEEPTVISGTKEFLEAMCAEQIQPMARRFSFIDRLTGKAYGPGNLYTGLVAAGTPVCEEGERIVLGDGNGLRTVAMKSYSTVLDGLMREETGTQKLAYQFQTVGYLETPQPLGAGVYVICEEKAPAGYVRSRPVAVEVYSDAVTYYKEGKKDARVLAACYEEPSQYQTAHGNKPQDTVRLARIYMENAPILLQVEKKKESSANRANTTEDKTVTYQVSGRIDGTLAEIGGRSDYVYAYENGRYLGYAWKKGTLEMLAARKAAGEQVELVFEGTVFAGYGYVTRTLETADDENGYVAGAVMTLFDALELHPSGDTEDHAYEGLVVERSLTNNVTRMYVKEGYAGQRVDYVKEKDEDGQEYVTEYEAGVDGYGNPVVKTGNIWTAVTLQRHDTDILCYDLDKLEVLTTERMDGRDIAFGYGRNHEKLSLDQLEAEKANFDRTDTAISIYAFRGGVPYLEFVGGDFRNIRYSAWNKVITADPETRIYHLDADGNRDALVDPYTGMAYVTEVADGKEKVLVWAVNLRRDEHGNIISRDKITTSRLATVGEFADGYGEQELLEVKNYSGKEIPDSERPSYVHEESGYLTGTWDGEGSGESHQEETVRTSPGGKNLNGEVLADQNNGSFEKNVNPVLDEHGLPVYYQRSEEAYDKGTELYDRNDEFVRYQDSDNLESYNNNAYRIQEHERLFDGDETKEEQGQASLYHRLGEGYILENTWVTSDQTPNDPFHNRMTDGQPDILKRVPAGTYIMEELACPDGYVKGMPEGITVLERREVQQVSMVDQTTKVEITKVDGTADAGVEMGSYSFGQVPGAVLALYEAERVYTDDWKTYPKGYYLKKTGLLPVWYLSTENTAGNPKEQAARWLTGEHPVYAEGIPAGDYILEELRTPSGFVVSEPVEVEIKAAAQVQTVSVYNDHTRVEFEKYCQEDGKEQLLPGAGFALYPAVTDEHGIVVEQDGKLSYYDDQAVDTWESCDPEVYREFVPAFEAMYKDYGAKQGLSLVWTAGGREYRAVCESVETIGAALGGGSESSFPDRAVMVMRTVEGMAIRVSVYGQYEDRGGRNFTYEYQFDYKKLPQVNAYAASYDTLEGRHRIDYLPAGGVYVLREVKVPQGFAKAEDQVVQVENSPQVQLVQVENQEGMLLVSKTLKNVEGELVGAHLALYRANEDGELVQEKDYLVADWLTGEGGVYTEADAINRRIPDGFQKGDLKPHPVHRLDDGIYWLVELESPDYLNTFEPVRVEYQQGEEIRVVRTVDTVAEGELVIRKTDKAGAPLHGAVYELSAYRQSDLRTPVFTDVLTGAEDTLSVSGLVIGEITADGKVVPYRYKLKEVTPPDGYAVNTEIFTWQFEPDRQGISYEFGETAKKEVVVEDQKTRIVIGKRDFDVFGDRETSGAFVAGAELALYEVEGRDEKDNWIYRESEPVDTWVSGRDGEENGHVTEGLVAGHTYLLLERKAPEGYHLMEPILFTLSVDGRRIASVSNRLNTVTVHTIQSTDVDLDTENPDRDSIQAVTVRGRYGTGVEYVLSDRDGTELARWRAAATEQVFVRGQGIREGESHTLTEITRYSDGSEAVTGKITKQLYFDENGQCRMPGRMVDQVTLTMQHEDGAVIDEFSPDELVPEKTIQNNVMPEYPKITMWQKEGKPGDALNPGQAVYHRVTFLNPAYHEEDMEIVISLGEGTEMIDGGDGVPQNGRWVYQMPGMKALEAGSISFVTSVEAGTLSSSVTATVRGGGASWVTTKTVPVLQKNQLTIFNELTGSGKRLFAEEESRFRVRLYHGRTGEELKGTYEYQGSRSGTVRSGETITLGGNEFVTIDPGLYRDVRYEVVREADGRSVRAWGERVRQEVSSEQGSEADVLIEETSGIEENGKEADGDKGDEREADRNKADRGAADAGVDGSITISGIASHDIGGFAVFTRCLPNTQERERFRKGESYLLTETTAYTDGTIVESSRMQVTLEETASVESITALDRATKVSLSKVELSGGEELPGCEMELRDQDGTVIDTWISGDEPHEIEGVLIPGETYILIERSPAPGYSYAEQITFTINEDGTVEQVVMVDRPTYVTVEKRDGSTGLPVKGALLQIVDEQGQVWDSWESDGDCHEVAAKLCAGQLYQLHEEKAPAGYQGRDDLAFVVPKNGEILALVFANDRVRHSGGGSSDGPDVPKRLGHISVHYQAEVSAAGEQIYTVPDQAQARTWLGGGRRLSQTGDDSRGLWYAGLAAVALLGLLGCGVWIWKNGREDEKRGRTDDEKR